MECNVPTDIVFSFAGLASRGGKHGPHADGWGLALYDGKIARVFLEPTAAARIARSRRSCASIRSRRCSRSRTSAARRAAAIGLVNTHPFTRELWGRHFVFAHNGTVKSAQRRSSAGFKPDRRHRQRARVLRAARARSSTTSSDYPRSLRGARRRGRRVTRSRSASGGTFNMLLGDGSAALRALRDEAPLHHPPRAVQEGDARRRGRHASTSRRSRRRGTASRSSRRCR